MGALPIPKPVDTALQSRPDLLASLDGAGNPALLALQDFARVRGAAFNVPTPENPLALAFSGGADSTALLLAAKTLWPTPNAVIALHIHHGLQEEADAFETMASGLCTAYSIPFFRYAAKVNVKTGESVEEQARLARYPALARLAKEQGASCVLLAHHADDQVETVLLALTRGAGLAGLAAMPESFARDEVVFYRPLLQVAAPALRQYLDAKGVSYVKDPMNERMDLVRGKLRHALLPALEAQFPAFRKTIVRSAAHLWQAQTLLSDMAAEDLQRTGSPPRIKDLQRLSPARMGNVLRHYIQSLGLRAPQSAQMQALVSQVQACTTRGHQIHLKVGEGFALRQGACLVATGAVHHAPSEREAI